MLGINNNDPENDKVTLIEGNKASLADHLATLKERRVLYLTRNAISMKQAVASLSKNTQLKLLTPYSESGLYTPAEQIKALISKRQHLLREAVTVLAECLDYKVFPEYTCERAAILFNNVVKPLHDTYVSEQGAYPFATFFQRYLGLEELGEDKTQLWEVIETIFKELAEVAPFENLRDDKERAAFLLCTPSAHHTKVILMTE